jgi:hypothetical protein
VLVADPGFTQVYLGSSAGWRWLVAVLASAAWAQFTLVFLAVQLALSVFTRADYLFTEVAHSSAGVMPSDVAVMAQHLGGPFWVWGLACGLVSLAVLLAGLAFYTRGETRVSLGALRLGAGNDGRGPRGASGSRVPTRPCCSGSRARSAVTASSCAGASSARRAGRVECGR